MKKTFKKSLALLLTFLLSIVCFSAVPMTGLAEDPAPADIDIDYISEKMHYVDVASGKEINIADVIGKDADGNELKEDNITKYSNISLNAYTKSTGISTAATGPNATQFDGLTDGKLGDNTEALSSMGLFGSYFDAKTCKDYGDGNHSWVTEHQYAYDYIIELKFTSDIKAIAIGSSYTCPIGDHDIYVSDNKADLFSGSPVASYQMDTDKWIANRDSNHKASSLGVNLWKANKNAEIKGKYIGIRVWIGNAMAKYMGDSGKYYYDRVRLNEFAVYGKFNCNYYDYKVTSSEGDIVNYSGNGFEDKDLIFEAPLSEKIYRFKDWTVNGATVTGEKDEKNNKNILKIKLDKNLTIVANYDSNAKAITSKNYKIDTENNLIAIPYGEYGMKTYYGFDNYRVDLAIKDNDRVIEENERVKSGMIITQPNVAGTDTLEIVNPGDYDLNGTINVTDIIGGLDSVLSKSAPENTKTAMALDVNMNGKYTVTDIIGMRNIALRGELRDSYDYNTYSASQMKYKYQGRKYVKPDGNIVLEMTASGIEFEADCVGDITLTVAPSKLDMYATVVVDGVADNDVLLNTSAAGQAGDIVIAKDVPAGKHTIGIYKQLEGGTTITIGGLKFYGENTGAAPQKEKLIEFVGDSITCGAGNTGEPVRDYTRHENGYMAYSAQTARMLDYDYACISNSGSILISGSARVMTSEYDKISTYNTATYDNSVRPADIVVVAMGTNDRMQDQFDALFEDTVVSFAKKLIEKNGKDVKIVFCHGMMGFKKFSSTTGYGDYDNVREKYQSAIARLAKDGITAYYTDLPTDMTGGSSHPTIAGDTEEAKVLSAFIKNTVLAD